MWMWMHGQYNWMSTLKSALKNAAYVSGVVLVDPLLPASSGQGGQVPFQLVVRPDVWCLCRAGRVGCGVCWSGLVS